MAEEYCLNHSKHFQKKREPHVLSVLKFDHRVFGLKGFFLDVMPLIFNSAACS